MGMAKRVLLFVGVNLLVVVTISILTSVLGIRPFLQDKGIDYSSLMAFCLLWGFGGAFISLAISRMVAKWTMGVKLISPKESNSRLRELVQRVHTLSQRAGLKVMPEVGYYESPDINAFATGPTKNRSLVAVSTGLLERMNDQEVEGVLAHEVAHIANGDMVTMTLVQGIVNAFVMFVARIAAFFVSQMVEEEKRTAVQFGVTLALEVVLGFLGMMVVAAFSRYREFRADAGGAQLAGRGAMVAALERLKLNMELPPTQASAAMASLQISSRKSGLMSLFSTHPDLEDRIMRLKRVA